MYEIDCWLVKRTWRDAILDNLRSPGWWAVIISALQLVTVGIVGVVLKQTIDRNAKDQQLRVEIENPNENIYIPAARLLIQEGSRGRTQLSDYLGIPSCMDWPKVLRLAETLRSSRVLQDRQQATRSVWSALHGCYFWNLPVLADFYRFLKADSEIGCDIIQQHLRFDGEAPILHQVGLLAVIESACTRTDNARSGIAQFQADVKKAVASKACASCVYIDIDHTFPWILGPFQDVLASAEPDPDSWQTIAYGVRDIFEASGPRWAESLWKELGREDLLSALVLADIMFHPGSSQTDSTYSLHKTELFRWIQIGLTSVDTPSRYAAVVMVSHFELTDFGGILERLAENDKDGVVRQMAFRIVTYLSGRRGK